MPFNYYSAPTPQSTSPAYQMLLEATMRAGEMEAASMSRLFDPLTQAMQHNQELGVQREGIAAESKRSQDYLDVQRGHLKNNERELDLKEGDAKREMEGNDAVGKLLMSRSPRGYAPSTSTDGSVGGGHEDFDHDGFADMHGPEMAAVARWKPQLAMEMIRLHDAQEENERQKQDGIQKQKAADEMRGSFTKTIDRGEKEGWIKPTTSPALRARLNNPQDYDALGKELTGMASKHIEDTEDTRAYTEQYKALRKTVESDKEGDPARKSDLLKQFHAIDIGNQSPKDKSKALTEAYGKTYDPNRTKDKADKGPFKYLKDTPAFYDGGVIERAPGHIKARVKLEAMEMAANEGRLRQDVLVLASANPSFDKLSGFYDKMSAAEKAAVTEKEQTIWEAGGWVPEPKFNLPGDVGPAGIPGNAPAPEGERNAAAPTAQPSLMDLAPEQRGEALRIYQSGDKEALKAFLMKSRGGAHTSGPSVMDKPKPKSDTDLLRRVK